MGYLGYKPADKPLTAADITDSIITSAKIVDGTIVNGDINASAAIVSTKLSGAANTPAFLARNDGSTSQAIANTTWTEITIFNTEEVDTNSAYNTVTSRFTPQVAGKYVFFANVLYTTLPSGGLYIGISKNGNITGNANTDYLFASANIYGPLGACILDLNGTTDYVSVFTLHSFGSSRNIGGAGSGSYMNFHGYRLIGV